MSSLIFSFSFEEEWHIFSTKLESFFVDKVFWSLIISLLSLLSDFGDLISFNWKIFLSSLSTLSFSFFWRNLDFFFSLSLISLSGQLNYIWILLFLNFDFYYFLCFLRNQLFFCLVHFSLNCLSIFHLLNYFHLIFLFALHIIDFLDLLKILYRYIKIR